MNPTHRAIRTVAGALVVAAAALLAAPARGEGPALATYQGADRLARLIEGAKREGEVTIYTSTPVEDIKVLTDAFERKYGVRTKVWRASSEKVLQRGVAEARAGRFDVDVFETNGPELEALVREKLLTPVWSPALPSLVAEARFPHQSWVGTRLVVFAFAYNTTLVRKADLPAAYAGFADPKWKGKLGIEAEDADWFATVSGVLGETAAEKLFRDVVATNGVSIRKGHTLLANLVASGEVALALTVYNYKAEQLKNKGAPIDWFVIPPAIARVNGVGVAARPPHPNAALLWYEFEIGDEGQQLLLSREFVPTNRNIETPLNRFPLRFVDSKTMLDDAGKWERRYAEIFGRPR
jgi:iron(III) transport system substrate-binding protein